MSESVIVCVRCRPFNEKEKQGGYKKIVNIDTKLGQISITNYKENPNNNGSTGSLNKDKNEENTKTFTFDSVFDEDCKQIDVYNQTARNIIDGVLNGFNGTVFAYGQTGSGKTFSMQGSKSSPELRGIIPNAFDHIFSHISRTTQKKWLVRVSYLEIYNEEIKDLLGKDTKKKLELKENPETGVYVKDLSSYVVKSVEEIDNLMTKGNKNRAVGATLMNAESSRSHSIFTITVECCDTGIDGKDHFYAGKLHLVDLAGSERQSKTGATGERLKEATKINLSLSALGNCISALVDGKSKHIPYRDSKLTRLLQDSLGGNSKTLMIATLSPASYNYDETLSTLRYANRAKNIKNKPKINEDPKDAMLREYQEEIQRLRKMLETKAQNNNGQEKNIKVIKRIVKKIVKKKKPKVKKENGEGNTNCTNDNEEGEEYDEYDDDDNDDDDDDENGEDPLSSIPPEDIEKLQAEVEAEKKQLLESKDIANEEKQRIIKELEERVDELAKERQSRMEMSSKLKKMEEKLLIGGVNIFDRVNSQQRELEETQLKIEEKRRIERELQRQLELKQETQLQMEEHYASLQEEADVKSRKLQKLWKRFQALKSEICDLQDEFRKEREDLLDTIREISRDLNLKTSIIENFIPEKDRAKIEKRVSYDEENDEWILAPLTQLNLINKVKRPVSLYGLRYPTSQYAKTIMLASAERGSFMNSHARSHNHHSYNYEYDYDLDIPDEVCMRYKNENIICIPMDLPERTTFKVKAENNVGGMSSESEW
ncbi:kinesin-domain-containing protein [Neocallimastix lanati (nom. inval.)]|jgi:kinesin family protein 3/17|uniref:Kinesin-like protein n=1 Tax=Neocallimastix californiae TaxID=1754190 RepID=A0A1Y2CFV9_9FUNG|nr:kinesin-domain-containing protein [Neocallimastix sp. JGI-2020a]ORY45787.1 kinesin-domain-containing protein [Neocallimastix californiae]|eukprot:ORY45787.1 kinesin-domain-containing protein [Neocallimastix californiae]